MNKVLYMYTHFLFQGGLRLFILILSQVKRKVACIKDYNDPDRLLMGGVVVNIINGCAPKPGWQSAGLAAVSTPFSFGT